MFRMAACAGLKDASAWPRNSSTQERDAPLGENFQGELTDFIQFQCEIAQTVACEIRLEAARRSRLLFGRPWAAVAYDAYIRAIFHAIALVADQCDRLVLHVCHGKQHDNFFSLIN